ncbi:MAG TPA: PD-(D/E)XK nuclease family protein, partial [Vicinamibacterales bacterium]|nr:PD-(D/E)XK nuclease family protein [Vicinamibacterales bacterium]
LLARAARQAGARTWISGTPFEIRPGLAAAMLDFYDELRRRQRSVRRLVRALFDQLRVERGTDRGSESLIRQTCFLGFTWLAYERLVNEAGAIDEHQLRARLLERTEPVPFDHVVVAVTDRPSDPRGLWPADFDLLGRLPGVQRIDVVVTDETHDAGFRERIERELPGIEEVRHVAHASAPVLVRPADGPDSPAMFVSRDREEELRDVARAIRARATDGRLTESVAVVFQRPLPYLYLARQVLVDARVPYQAFDALPLASEPYAALLDLVLACARTGGVRDAAVALLRSPLLRFEVDGEAVALGDVSALDAVLLERRATGVADSFAGEVDAFFGARADRRRLARAGAARAACAAAGVAADLAGFSRHAPASAQVACLSAFLRRHERPAPDDDEWRDRHLRARAAVLAALDGLAAAYAAHDDEPREADALTSAIHHVVEGQTFAPRRGHEGVHLVDAVAARFGQFAHVHLVGLVETDWPERLRRNVFYTSGLLNALGWPQDADHTRDQQAAFRDLLGLAATSTTLHGFELEGDALVAASPMVELARGLPARVEPIQTGRPIFPDELIAAGAGPGGSLDAEPAAWLALRRRRPPLADPRYAGAIRARPGGPYRVSRVDRYIDCPFKYFAENVLDLPEERDDPAGLTPIERGTLVHDLFERFYRAWQAAGHGAITPATLPDALARFAALAREALAKLPAADRALEETRLLGSIVARGLAERVFELESDAGGDIVGRLIEERLEGPFTFPELFGFKQTVIDIRGKADRIDVFADGSLRVIDYKLGKLPDLDASVQIGVYAHAARQVLEAGDGRPHAVSAAMYLAFGDDRHLEGRLGNTKSGTVDPAIDAAVQRFVGAVRSIEAGEFPPRPRNPGDCARCAVAGVCRKEYRVESHEAAESL